jgi:glycosyltransferase involved in cell wall biosynthesis
MSATPVRIAICICTYRRPELLDRLLSAIPRLRTDGQFSCSVVVVDNDDQQSARGVVDRARAESSLPILYDVEPERSISHARNRSVKDADGELIAFIDDDEFPEDTWLLNAFKTLHESNADGVLGPVKPHFDAGAPRWLVRSGLCDRSRFKTGTVIRESKHTRTGNVLIRKSLFTGPDGSFDPKYGRSGGGDAVFFKRMIQKGKLFVWCDEACVFEAVPPERQTRAYYVRRAFTRGMTEAWETRFLRLGTLQSFVAILVYTAALPFLFVLGQHLFMKYAVKTCDHLGKILGYMGIAVVRERPYSASS